jgi:hypothetical protein
MEWKDLSDTTACVLERCWGIYDDNPRTKVISIGETFKVWNKEYTFTEANYNEMIKYAELTSEYVVYRVGDKISIRGKELVVSE